VSVLWSHTEKEDRMSLEKLGDEYRSHFTCLAFSRIVSCFRRDCRDHSGEANNSGREEAHDVASKSK
jgi:hypothetical protein